MTLEVLAKPTPKEPPVKGGARGAGERGEGDGFSTALSKAGRGTTSDDVASAGDRPASQTMPEDVAVSAEGSIRRSVKTALLGEERLPPEHGHPHKRPSDAGSGPGKTHSNRNSSADTQQADQVEERPDAAVEPEATGTIKTEVANAQGASDLLSILAGLQAATNAATSSRATYSNEGRRGADGNGERSTKVSGDASARRESAQLPSDMLDMPRVEDVESGSNKSFRFINTKDGSVNTELTTAARSRDRGASEGKTLMSQTENVMVMDSRRFIGLQSSSNSASLMAAMVGDQAWSSAMKPEASLSNIASQSSTGSVVHMLKLQMTPHDLGTVTATLKMSGEQLHVHLTVESRAAHRQLSEDSSGMLDALRSQGFSVDQVSISIAPNAEADPQKGQQGSQAGQQQTAANGERQGSANRNPADQQFSDTTNSRNGDSDASGDDATIVGLGNAGGAHSGQLYL